MCNKILFTGAGFTHNFGAPLAEDMKSILFNLREKHELSEDTKKEFNGDKNYEVLYQSLALKNKNGDKEKVIALFKDAYKSLDAIICRNNPDDTQYVFSKLISKFLPKNNEPTFFFTLNHDLFIERFKPNYEIILPGIDHNNFPSKNEELSQNHYSPIDTNADPKPEDAAINYIKLHGSQNWIDKNNDNTLMILGSDKSNQIRSNNLLEEYTNIFSKEATKSNTKILIIGYGFKDTHINDVLYKAAKEGTKFYIICPKKIGKFYDDEICGGADIEKIKKIWGNSYYYPCNLDELFNPNSALNIYWKNSLDEEFFE